MNTREASHDLPDFAWPIPVIFGTSTISNAKELIICTLPFDVEIKKEQEVINSRNIECTLKEAEQFLKQLVATPAPHWEFL